MIKQQGDTQSGGATTKWATAQFETKIMLKKHNFTDLQCRVAGPQQNGLSPNLLIKIVLKKHSFTGLQCRVINAFRMTARRYKLLISFIACLALALSSSCAHKKSAIERLIVQKPSDEVKRKVKEEKIRQSEPKKTVKTIEKPAKETSPIKIETLQEKDKVDTLQEEEIKKREIGKTIDSISMAISNITEKPQETGKNRQIENPVIEEIPLDTPEQMTADSKAFSLNQKKLQTIPQPSVPEGIQDEKGVSLNFESTDIKDIIITFCDLLKVDYILDPGISGKITLQTFKKAKIKDLFKILEKILILNNLTVVKTGNFYRFTPIEPAKRESLNIFFGRDSDLVPSRDRLIIQIIPLRHVSTSSMKSILAPLLSKHASFLDVPETNNLMIIDTATNIKRLLDVIKILDIEAAGNLQINLFPLKYSDAEEIAADIQEIFYALGYSSKRPPVPKSRNVSKLKSKTPIKRNLPKNSFKKKSASSASEINFIPVKRINSLVVINPFPELLPDIEFWISKLDKPLKLYIGKDPSLLPDDVNEQILQIIPLDFVTPGSLEKIIAPMLTRQGKLSTSIDNSSLIITDFINNIKWVLEIVNTLDVNALDKIQVKLFQVENARVDELTETLYEIFDTLGYTAGQSNSILKFVPIERLNSLLIINPFPGIMPDIESWIAKLDISSLEGLEEKIFIYYVQNAKAGDLASLLTTIYKPSELEEEQAKIDTRVGSRKKKPRISKTEKQKKGKGKRKDSFKQLKTLVKVKSIVSEEVSGNITFAADKFTNALIIKTRPKNYPSILETIKLLDLMPLQVMIEVLVLELTIDDQTRAGLDWAFRQGNTSLGSAASQSLSVGARLGDSATALLSQGFSFTLGTKKITSLFQAFAQDSKLKVLSNPVLITSENMPASINITNEVPIETSTITTPTAGQPLTQTTIQYKSVGIKLDITPQINRDRYVNLQISQESSNVNEAAAFSQPAFFTRSTNTNVVVKDKQTLVIGGLMETKKSYSDSGVPILKDIPLFGRLFKAKSDRLRKTELIIFITPYVIANISEANEATRNFRSKLLNVKKSFKLEKQKK